MMTLQEFQTEVEGKDINFEGCPTNSCMANMHKYLQDVLGITDPAALAFPTAIEVYRNFPNVTGADKFSAINNTPDDVPTPGDLVFFEQNEVSQTGEAGHVCIFLSGDVHGFTSLDSNWGDNPQPRVVQHVYDGVVGWLHPLEQPVDQPPVDPDTPPPPDLSVYPYGLDLNNPDSVKVCVDTWKEVTDGVFVRKEELDAANQKATELEGQLSALNEQHNQLQTQVQELPAQVKLDFASKIVKFFENL